MRTTSSREVYRNPWTRVREDVLELPDGSTSVYGVVERPDFALVLPVDRDGLWLVEQYRHPIGRRSWEFPQGTWSHGTDGSPEELARAELAEETGFRAGRLDHLGRLDLAPGLMTQLFDVWRASDLTAGPTAREASEADMRTAFVAQTELRAMIRDGRFTDGPSLAAYSLLLLEEVADPPNTSAGK
jgi:8-oxo-dGDP phosphatase